MESHDNLTNQNDTILRALWILVAISLSAIEMLLPRIPLLPWLKPGLANMITLLWIIRFGTKDAVIFTFLRSWIVSFYFGFSFITFMLSLGGGIFATIVMGLLWTIGKNRFLGTIGIGMIGAFAHNCAQLIIIYFTMAQNSFIFYQLPFMCGASLVFGSIIGALAPVLLPFVDIKVNDSLNLKMAIITKQKPLSINSSIAGSFFFILCLFVIFVKPLWLLLPIAIIITLVVQLVCGFSMRNVLYPTKFWMFFLFIAIIYLFFSYGTRIHGLPFITREGINETLNQFCRLWIWLETSLLLTHFKFHTFFFNILIKIFPESSSIFSAGLLALEHFPDILNFSKSKDAFSELHFFKHPLHSLKIYITRHKDIILKKICSDPEPS